MGATYEANRSPGEEGSESRDGQEPVKDDRARGCQNHVGKGTPDEVEHNRHKRATRPVNIGKDLGSVVLLGKGSQGTRAAVDARDTERDNRNADDKVHEGVITLEASVLCRKHEGRGTILVGVAAVEETVIGGADEHADKGKADDVEADKVLAEVKTHGRFEYSQSDTPEDLLDSAGQGLGRVPGLGGSKTNQFSTSEGEGGSDKDTAEAAEAVLERTRIIPQLGTLVRVKVAVGGATTADEDDGDDHEDDNGSQLEARAPELFLGVAQCSKDVDEDDDGPEYSDPYGLADVFIPILNREGAHG